MKKFLNEYKLDVNMPIMSTKTGNFFIKMTDADYELQFTLNQLNQAIDQLRENHRIKIENTMS